MDWMQMGKDSGIDLPIFSHNSSTTSDSDTVSQESETEFQKENKKIERQKEYKRIKDWYEKTYLKPRCCFSCVGAFVFCINFLFFLIGLGVLGLAGYGLYGLLMDRISKPIDALADPMFFLSMIGFVVFWVYKEVFPQLLSSYIFIPLIEKYRKGNHSRISEFTLDQMQQTFKCCGIDDKKNWQENEKFHCTNDICKLPNSCCKDLMDCSVSTDQKNETTLYFNEKFNCTNDICK